MDRKECEQQKRRTLNTEQRSPYYADSDFDQCSNNNMGSSTSTHTRYYSSAKAKLPKNKILQALKPLLTSMIQSSGLGTIRAESDLERTILLQASTIVDLKSQQEQILIRMLESSRQLQDVKRQMLEIQKKLSQNN